MDEGQQTPSGLEPTGVEVETSLEPHSGAATYQRCYTNMCTAPRREAKILLTRHFLWIRAENPNITHTSLHSEPNFVPEPNSSAEKQPVSGSVSNITDLIRCRPDVKFQNGFPT